MAGMMPMYSRESMCPVSHWKFLGVSICLKAQVVGIDAVEFYQWPTYYLTQKLPVNLMLPSDRG